MEPRGPVLVAERVVLRPLDGAAAGRILAGGPQDAERRAEDFPPDGTRQVARATLAAVHAGAPLGAFGAYLVTRTGDATVVGDVGLHGPPGVDGTVEVGFALAASARGAGLATEALRALASWALAQPGVRALRARAAPANVPSQGVLARAGFVPNGREGDLLRFRRPA